jgi:hypothetical protein
MRKLILISAFFSASMLASVSVQAGESRNLTFASNDEPKSVETSNSVETSKAVETTRPDEAVKADTARPEAKPRTSRSNKTHASRREGDEAKARRIAARYGVYW